MTRRRPTFWPGQSGNGAPRAHRGDGGHDAGGDHRPDHDDYELGDDEDDVLGSNSRLFPRTPRGEDEPVVKWRSVDRQLYVDAPWRQPDRDYRGTDATEILHEPARPEVEQPDDGDLESVYEDSYDDYADVDDVAYDDVEADYHHPRYSDAGYDDRPRSSAGSRPRFGRDDDEYMTDRGGRSGARDRYDDALPEPGWETDSPESVRAALLDSGRPARRDVDRRPPSRWRMALAERLVASWPGQSVSGVPADFPASGEVVMRPRRAESIPRPESGRERDGDRRRERGRDPERPKLVSLSDRLAPDAPLAGAGSLDRDRDRERDAGWALGSVAGGGGRQSARATASAASASEATDAQGRRLYGVVAAVYAALADPLIHADAATREQQAARFRRFGMMAGSVALAVVLIYAIFPVRTYLEQRSATARARERIDRLTEANAELEQRQAELSENETVEEIARRDYQLVFPGEESYGLLPPPVEDAPATTTTTPPQD